MIRRTTPIFRVGAALLALALASFANGQTPKDPRPETMGGRLTVRAIQGTAGAPAIGPCEVRVDLMHRGVVMDSLTATLDDNGEAFFEGLPIGAGFTPVATVGYAGVSYLRAGAPMGPDHAIGELEVTCYEVTSERPAWTISARQAMLVRDEGGLRVTEIVHVENPSDRTWLGEPHGYEKPATTWLTLPESASDIALGAGFHEWCCTSFENATLTNHLPLMPGTTELTFAYRIRPRGAETSLGFGAPVEIGEATIIVPLNVSAGAPRRLEEAGEARIADTDVRYYAASAIPADTDFGITVATSWAAASSGAGQAGRVGAATRWIAGLGAGVLLIGAIVLVALRRHSSPA